VHFRQTYYLAPRGKGADRAYALLRQAMHETGKVGIATMILRDKEHLVAVRPGDDVLILETMYFGDEIRSPSEELETLPQDASFQGRELEVAKRLVESLTVPWAPEDYHNTYRARVEELIERKREGQAVVFEAERPKSNVIDLMAALEASVEKMGPAAAGTGETGAGQARKGTRPAGGSRPAAGRGRAEESGPPDLDALSKADLLARAAELDEDVQAGAHQGDPGGWPAETAGPEDLLGTGRPSRTRRHSGTRRPPRTTETFRNPETGPGPRRHSGPRRPPRTTETAPDHGDCPAPGDCLRRGRFPTNLRGAGPAACDCRPVVIDQTGKEP
jgi:hypothetical protein